MMQLVFVLSCIAAFLLGFSVCDSIATKRIKQLQGELFVERVWRR